MNFKTHRHREDLAGEHRLGDLGQLVFACLFGAVWVLDTFFLEYTTFLNSIVPNAVRTTAGIVILALAAYLAITGMRIVFGEKRETPAVIRKSVFAFVRHPIYLSEILAYLGYLFLSLSLAALVVWVAAAFFLHFISRHEEKALLSRFGEEYARYMRDVPMWIPRICKKRHSP